MIERAAQGVVIAVVTTTVLLPQPSRAEDSASPMQFWLQQQPLVDQRSHASHPVFRPHRASVTARHQPASGTAATIAKPGFVVAVFGDSFGFDAARGLTDLYARNPHVAIFDATNDTASLASAVPAWGAAVTTATAQAGRVDAAVVMLGAADLQPIADDHGQAVAPDAPAWTALYADRVKRTAALFRDRRIPLVWVGLPVMRDDDLARRYAGLNAVVREAAATGGFTYVDSWAAFADDNGHYSSTGPDENGQNAKLRRDDGRRFTWAGARKLASFIEPELKRVEDKAEASAKLAAVAPADADVFDQALNIDINAQIRREAGLPPLPDPGQTQDGPVVDLTAPPSSADGRLATASTPVALTASAEAVLASGIAPPPRRGRTDDFSWPRL